MTTDEVRKIIREELQPMREDCRAMRHLLTGNGDPAKGLIVRVDRIEQRDSNRTWWNRAAIITAMGAAAASLRAWFG